MSSEHRHAHDHSHAPDGRDWATHADRLEREGQIAMPLFLEAVASIAHAVASPDDVATVVDLGSGPGVASVALAQRFPRAVVTAVDTSAPLLDRVSANAARAGVAGRVRTTVADLEQPLDGLFVAGSVDVVWASMVLHHVLDLPRTLTDVHRLLRPGGVFAVLEFGRTRGVLPRGFDVGRAGFVERHDAAVRAAVEAHLPPGAMSLDWPTLLTEAGFEFVEHRELAAHVPAPLAPEARAFVPREPPIERPYRCRTPRCR